MTHLVARTHHPAGEASTATQAGGRDIRALLNTPGGRIVLLDGSRDPNSGVTVFLTAPEADEPHLALKIATTSLAAEVIEREARVLVDLERRSLSRVEPTLPRHAGLFRVDEMLAVAASVVPGIPMQTRYHAFRHLSRPASVGADFAAAERWLSDLHADSMSHAAPLAVADGMAERIAARWPADPRADELAGRLGPIADRLRSATVPRTVVHGDFWPGNLLMTGDAITGVVDWASGAMAGDPLRDVARFALSYSLYLDRHTRPGRSVSGHPGLRADGWGAGIRYAIAGEHWFGKVVSDFVAGALLRLGAPADLWRDVLLAGIGEVAITADHPDFAAHHRDLLLRFIREMPT
jgi:hypothetical protein